MKTTTNVMANAWKIAGLAQAKFDGKVRQYFAESMKLAWTFEKKENPSRYAPKVEEPKVEEPKAKNVPRETMPKKVQAETEYVPMILHNNVPSNIRDTFGNDVADTCNEMINRYVTNANKYEGEHRRAKAFNYVDGMEKGLRKVETFVELQGVMCAFFLRDYITIVARKNVQMGIGYKAVNKKLGNMDAQQFEAFNAKNEQMNSYQNASSNAGMITAYDVEDIVNEVIADAYTFEFSDKMFDAPQNVMMSIFFRISNATQRMMTQLRNQTKVVTAQKQYVQEESATRSTEEEALKIAEEMGIFGEEEMTVLKMAVAGFKKKEIDAIMGKRTDRTFKRMEKLYTQVV